MSQKTRFHGRFTLALVISLILTACQQPVNDPARQHPITPSTRETPSTPGKTAEAGASPHQTADVGAPAFDRHPNRLILTRHARCRMGCRHITEKEIREILDHGAVNDRKSEPNAHPDPKYALEGNTDEGQHLRVIIAVPPAGHTLVIVTCMELGVEWQCDCK